MELILFMISELCWDIIQKVTVNLVHTRPPYVQELLNEIKKLYPTLKPHEFALYWRYNKDFFIHISDYFTYSTVLNLINPGNCAIYLLLNDADIYRHRGEIRDYLKFLDELEILQHIENSKSKYDVEYRRPNLVYHESFGSVNFSPEVGEIMTYALRKQPETKCFTIENYEHYKLINILKMGVQQLQGSDQQLSEVEEVVIGKPAPVDVKSKDKADKSDKIKDKAPKKKK